MDTINQLFEGFGGTSAVARAIGKGQSTASEMRRRRKIPLSHWPVLIAAAQAQGINLDEATLVRIHLSSAEASSEAQAASDAA